MKTISYLFRRRQVWMLLGLMGIVVLPVSAQDKEKKSSDGPTHIHIEKMENGKRKILDKTYQPGEKIPENFDQETGWQEVPGDVGMNRIELSFNEDNLKFNLDSAFRNFHFSFPNDVPFLGKGDSLWQNNLFNPEDFAIRWHKDYNLRLDSLFNNQQEMMKEFRFDFDDTHSFPFEPGQERYEFDEEEYEIKEREDSNGRKKIIVIRKEKAAKDKDKTGMPDKKAPKSKKP